MTTVTKKSVRPTSTRDDRSFGYGTQAPSSLFFRVSLKKQEAIFQFGLQQPSNLTRTRRTFHVALSSKFSHSQSEKPPQNLRRLTPLTRVTVLSNHEQVLPFPCFLGFGRHSPVPCSCFFFRRPHNSSRHGIQRRRAVHGPNAHAGSTEH